MQFVNELEKVVAQMWDYVYSSPVPPNEDIEDLALSLNTFANQLVTTQEAEKIWGGSIIHTLNQIESAIGEFKEKLLIYESVLEEV